MKELLKITQDEKGIEVKIDSLDECVMAITDYIAAALMRHDQKPLDVFFAINTHLLARTPNDAFEKDYIENLRKSVAQYRKAYLQMLKKMAS